MGKRLSHYTTDHDTIKEWAEERGGTPAAVKRTTRGDDDPGIIRIDFPGYSGQNSLKKISWKEWFKKFDDNNLVLVYQEETGRGQKSNFNKIISAESATERKQQRESADRRRSSGARSGSSRSGSSRSAGSSRSGSSRSGSSRSGSSRSSSGGRSASSRSRSGRDEGRSSSRSSSRSRSSSPSRSGSRSSSRR